MRFHPHPNPLPEGEGVGVLRQAPFDKLRMNEVLPTYVCWVGCPFDRLPSTCSGRTKYCLPRQLVGWGALRQAPFDMLRTNEVLLPTLVGWDALRQAPFDRLRANEVLPTCACWLGRSSTGFLRQAQDERIRARDERVRARGERVGGQGDGLEKRRNGGPSWTRTTDLSLIRTAL